MGDRRGYHQIRKSTKRLLTPQGGGYMDLTQIRELVWDWMKRFPCLSARQMASLVGGYTGDTINYNTIYNILLRESQHSVQYRTGSLILHALREMAKDEKLHEELDIACGKGQRGYIGEPIEKFDLDTCKPPERKVQQSDEKVDDANAEATEGPVLNQRKCGKPIPKGAANRKPSLRKSAPPTGRNRGTGA